MNHKNDRAWIQFILSISVVVIIATLGIFIGVVVKNNNLINQEILTRSKAHIDQMLKTREWNSHYGGVYVEKRAGDESNPYMDDPDIQTLDGKVYTLKNPALMTREISELFSKSGLLTFHMSSEKYLNPKNAPDEFEKTALQLFEKGNMEVFRKNQIGNRTSFRYMAPLYIKEECLRCHGKHGYKLGDLRGGISVEFDISQAEDHLFENKFIIMLLGIVCAFTLLGMIFAFAFILKRKLDNAQKLIERMAIVDDLTGLYNRRHFFSDLSDEKQRAMRFDHNMGCIMLDIDHFKEINDTYGHDAGDMLLVAVADMIKLSCRQIDTVARYGGDEFIVLLPGTDIGGVKTISEKIRQKVEQLEVRYSEDTVLSVTVSIGATSFDRYDLEKITDNDLIVKKADDALYKGKKLGRNRVEMA